MSPLLRDARDGSPVQLGKPARLQVRQLCIAECVQVLGSAGTSAL
jgi:hypothetical protein